MNGSCAEGETATNTQFTQASQSNTTNIKTIALKDKIGKTPSKQQLENFDKFYELFTDAVNKQDWDVVTEFTQFPFIFKGQLDMEGDIKMSKQEFKKAFPTFLENETYIDLQGELIPSTFRGLLMTRMGAAESVSNKSVQIHDFVFEKIGNHWKFVKVYIDLSLIKYSRYRQGGCMITLKLGAKGESRDSPQVVQQGITWAFFNHSSNSSIIRLVGGNQSDQVNESEFYLKSYEIIAYRKPPAIILKHPLMQDLRTLAFNY